MTKKKRKSQLSEILKFYKDHCDRTDNALNDYIAEDGLIEQITDSNREFIELIEDIVTDEEDVYNGIDALMDRIKEKKDELDGDELLNLMDENTVSLWLESKNYICIKPETLDKEMKIKEFLTEEIYPFYNDQTHSGIF